jgi:hypothetical protein
MEKAKKLEEIKCNCGQPILHTHLKDANKDLYANIKKADPKLTILLKCRGCGTKTNTKILGCLCVYCYDCIKQLESYSLIMIEC